MPNHILWCKATCLRFADNTNDNPSQEDVDAVQAHWDAEFGASLKDKMSDAGIADTPLNRAIVQMVATLSPGTASVALRRACRFFNAVEQLS